MNGKSQEVSFIDVASDPDTALGRLQAYAEKPQTASSSSTQSSNGVVGAEEDDLDDQLDDPVSKMLHRLHKRTEAERQLFKVPKFKEHCMYCNLSFLNFYDARDHKRTVSHRQKEREALRKKAEAEEAERLAKAPKKIHLREMFLKNAERKVWSRNVAARLSPTSTTSNGAAVTAATSPMVQKIRAAILKAANKLKEPPPPPVKEETYDGDWVQVRCAVD